MAHEVLLRLEDGFWKRYVDMVYEIGSALCVDDRNIAIREAQTKAKEFSPCELIVISYHGNLELHEYY